MKKSIDDQFRQHQCTADASVDSTRLPSDEKIEQNKAGTGELILVPEEMDILCGQDKTFSRHTGNQAFKRLVATYANTYREATSRQDKMAITVAIVESLENTHNARFLRPVANGWEVLSRTRARDKVSHALRWLVQGKDRTKKARKTGHRQGSSSADHRSSSGSLSSTSSLESEASQGFLEDMGTEQTKPSIDSEQLDLQRRRSFPPIDYYSTEEPPVVVPVATRQRSQSEPNVSMPSGDQDDFQPTTNTSVETTASEMSSFDEVLTNSNLASLLTEPILPDGVDDVDMI